MLTVHDLRKKGYKVRVLHTRRYEQPNQFGRAILLSKGGLTEVCITQPGHDVISAAGVARCSQNENFNRKLGVRIALGRALKQLRMCTK